MRGDNEGINYRDSHPVNSRYQTQGGGAAYQTQGGGSVGSLLPRDAGQAKNTVCQDKPLSEIESIIMKLESTISSLQVQYSRLADIEGRLIGQRPTEVEGLGAKTPHTDSYVARMHGLTEKLNSVEHAISNVISNLDTVI